MTARSNVTCPVALAAVLLFAGGMAPAAEPAKPDNPPAATQPAGKSESKGPLAGLPSALGAHIEKINAKAIILNNQHLGMVMQWEDKFYGGNRGHTYLGDPLKPKQVYPDFIAMAATYSLGVFNDNFFRQAILLWAVGRKPSVSVAELNWSGRGRTSLSGWELQGVRVLSENQGKWDVKKDFGLEAKKAAFRAAPPDFARQRLYVNPRNRLLYVGEDTGFDKSFEQALTMSPNLVGFWCEGQNLNMSINVYRCQLYNGNGIWMDGADTIQQSYIHNLISVGDWAGSGNHVDRNSLDRNCQNGTATCWGCSRTGFPS
jgi:hypothetical protein